MNRTSAHWNSMARKGRVRAATGSDNEGPNDDGKKIAQVVPQQPPADDGFPELPSHFELKRSSKSGTAVPMKSSGVGLSQRKKPAPLTLPVELGSGDARSSQSAAKSRAATAAEEGSGEEMAMNELFPSDSMLDVTKPTAGDGPTLAVAARRVFVGSTETNVDDNGHRYVGLRNQAMTCYLNSLIQTLYMTPEFRNAIYKWKFLGKLEDEGRSIACQLQKLFLLLQTSDKESLETKDLTASFGWSGCEVYDQHDVQELCRVMFDALEHKWRNTSNSSLIQDLYRGTMVDFVKCLNCQRESVKPDTFLDLPLAINHGGTGDAYKSVEEALHAFVKPEILDGVNQYSCGNCGTNQNALKGLRFTQFPYLLTIQLKRFDFDRNTFHRIKLNDKMTFPMLLNLNEFVHCPSKSAQIEVPKKMSWANAVASNRKAAPPPAPPRVNYVERAEQQSLHIDEEEVEALVKKEGPCLYELFSVMVHQGSAAGGHYFAYIKNMDQDAWFCFNDCSVTAATIEDIHRTFGGSSGGWSSSNTNAYMLMYRKIDRQRNAKFVKTVNLPSHLGSLLQRWEREEEEKLERKRLEETLVNVIVLYNGGPSTLRETQCTLRIPYTTKLRDVFVDAMLNFAHPDQLQSKNDVRLLKCGSFMFSIMCSFTSSQMEEMTLAEAFPNCASKAGYRADVHLMLDCKPHTMPFFYEIFEVGSFTLNVVPVNVERAELFGGRLVQFSETETVRMMKAKLAALYSEPPDEVDKLRLVLDKGAAASPTMILLDDDDLRSTFILTGTTVTAVTLFVDAGSPGAGRNEDRRMDFIKSRMFKILERKKHSLSLKIRLPNSAEYKHMGLSAPDSMATSRSTTPVVPVNQASATATVLASAPVVITNLQCVPQIHPLQTPLLASSHLSPASSNISDDEKDMMECCHSGALSDVCTPVLSPSLSEVEDLSDMEEANSHERCERYERTFNAVAAASSDRVSEIGGMNIGWRSPFEQFEQTPRSSAGTITGGTHTPSSAGPHEILTLNRVVGELFNELVVSVDGRQLVTELKEWISEMIGLPSTQFVVLKHYNEDDDGYDCNATNENETVRDAYSTVNHISVKLRAPLKENERLIRVVRFDADTDEHEKWPFLFEVAGTVDMSVRVLLQRCREMLDTVCALNHDLNGLRLRDMVTGLGVPTLNMADRLGRRGNEWHKTVYLQILTEEQAEEWSRAGMGAYPVMVRRWKPSTLEVGPLVELTLSALHKDQVAALKNEISTHYHVPVDQIELTAGLPANAWSKWPYTKERIELIDNVEFTSAGKVPPTGTFNGKLVYFRLSGEPIKQLNSDEKRAIRLKDSTVKCGESVSSRRPERPLRIQLSTSISDDFSMDP